MVCECFEKVKKKVYKEFLLYALGQNRNKDIPWKIMHLKSIDFRGISLFFSKEAKNRY